MASGLLTEQQLADASAALRAADAGPAAKTALDPQQLADRLVQMGHLNVWQAKQLLDGKIKFTLGPYRIVDSIGQGGMGHVYKAQQQVFGHVVAIKVLPREKSTPEAIANFNREVQALAMLNHPKLVRALDADKDGNVYYLVTEYVPGSDLRKLVRRAGPLSMELAASIVSQVAEGLQHAHEQGIVHRDVKPGNVLVTPEGVAKLSDLGLAGPMSDDIEKDPRHGKIVGTADYLSPDHILNPRHPVPAWDIYSLGCTLYYAVTGKVPFPGGTTAEKARAHCELRPIDPRRLNHRLTDDFVDVLADMMAKDPAERIQSAAEVIERLAPWTSGSAEAEASGAAPPMPPPVPSVSGPPPLPVVPPPGSAGPSDPAAPPVLAPPRVALRPLPVPPPLPARETLSVASSLADTGPESEDSLSLIVDTRHRPPTWVVVLAILAPIAAIGVVIAVLWMQDMLFSF